MIKDLDVVEVGTASVLPYYCILELSHAPICAPKASAGLGYVSHGGHQFCCKDPTVTAM